MSTRTQPWLRCAVAGGLLMLTVAATAADLLAGDATRGAVVAVACQACHGTHGEGLPANGYPRLAGQTASYLAKKLRDYSTGLRLHPLMTPIAKTYSPQQQADVAAYFAGLQAPDVATVVTYDAALLARGRLLARTGDEARQLQACANCHGPDGSGEPFAAPYLAGQPASYLTSAIGEWKSGARKNDAAEQMSGIARRLDDRDVAAVAAYFESLGRVGVHAPQ